MGKDSNLRLQFDELMKSGEKAAASLDGSMLEKVTVGLAEWEQKLSKSQVDEDFLNYVRKKIVRYREICGFVAETMYSALVYASQGTPDGQAVSHARQVKQRSRCSWVARVASSPSSSDLIK